MSFDIVRAETRKTRRPYLCAAWNGCAYVSAENAFSAIEFFGRGDPFFGGSADDRPLGVNGEFLTGSYHRLDIQRFTTLALAEAAAAAAKGRREGGLISAGESPERDPSV